MSTRLLPAWQQMRPSGLLGGLPCFFYILLITAETDTGFVFASNEHKRNGRDRCVCGCWECPACYSKELQAVEQQQQQHQQQQHQQQQHQQQHQQQQQHQHQQQLLKPTRKSGLEDHF
ncbi:hypothetical protein FHG87_010362 [Trinorchestia longiramus]|nr:hypothetical protein FHG87_010362 [Trinorchestia longiramus]